MKDEEGDLLEKLNELFVAVVDVAVLGFAPVQMLLLSVMSRYLQQYQMHSNEEISIGTRK